MTTRKISPKQHQALNAVILAPGSNTNKIACLVGGKGQAYDTVVRDRLMRLEQLGFIDQKIIFAKTNPIIIVARTWFPTELGEKYDN